MSTRSLLTITADGDRDLAHMASALRHYRAARSQMACSRRPVILFDCATGKTLRLETMKDVRMLLYAAAAAYRGARSSGLADDAADVLKEIREGRQQA